MTNKKNPTIVFYDFDFEPRLSVRKYISLNLTKNYCAYGTLEIHFPKSTSGLSELLAKNNRLFIAFDDCFAVLTGYIADDELTVFAKTAEWLMTKRVIKSLDCASETAESFARRATLAAMSDFVSLGTYSALGSTTDRSIEEITTVYDAVRSALDAEGLGFRLTPDFAAKNMVFEVYSGENRLEIISEELRTASDTTFTADYQCAVSNSGWYRQKITQKGDWNAYNNSPYLRQSGAENAYTAYRVVGDSWVRWGLSLKEGDYIYSDNALGTWKVSESAPSDVWVYIDGGESGIARWDTFISTAQSNLSDAKEALSKLTDTTDIETTTRRLEYGTDYSLGDTLRVSTVVGGENITLTKRVESVDVFYDVDTCGVRPTLK